MKTILIADDDVVMLKLYELNLKKAGFRTLSCKDGLSVLPLLQTENPSLAILDYQLPGKTGLELIQACRADKKWKELPLVVITAQGKESIRNELMCAGANVVFTKPFSPSRLIKTIEALLFVGQKP